MFLVLSRLGLLTVLGAETPATLSQLAYHFTDNVTNVYSLHIESQGESGREIVEGNFVITSRGLSGGLYEVTFQGQLRPQPVPGSPSMVPYYRPGGPVPLFQVLGRSPRVSMSMVIDEQGQVLRQTRGVPLPVPLGELMTSLILEFPSAAATNWNDVRIVSVLDEPQLLGPALSFASQIGPYMGYPPGRGGQGILTARQRRSAAVTRVEDGSVTLETSVSLDSLMLTGDEPRVSAAGEGEVVFDRQRGVPRRVQMECKTLLVTENLSRRSVVSVQWNLLEGEAREKALRPPAASRPSNNEPLSNEDLAALMEKLESSSEPERVEAARQLTAQEQRVEAPSPQFMELMSGLATDRNETVRDAALTMLAEHGGSDDVNTLIKALPLSDRSLRAKIAAGLGRIGDKRAAEPLAELLARGSADQLHFSSMQNNEVTAALVHLGPDAESAVLPLLKEKNLQTQYLACGILKDIGTRKSIRPLQDLTLSPVKEVSEAAAEALRNINARESW